MYSVTVKKILVLVVIFAMTLTFVSCAQNTDPSGAPSGYQLASDEQLDYKFYVPQTWTVDQNKGVSAAYVSDDRSSVSFMSFALSESAIEVSASGTSSQQLDSFWKKYADMFKTTYSDMEYITEGVNRLIANCASKTYVYTANVTGNPYKFMQVTALKDGIVYLFTYTAKSENYDSHIDDVEGILSNIVL